MSVVERTLGGRDYIHVRRKINKVQRQIFFPLKGATPEKIKEFKQKANQEDELLKEEQDKLTSFMGTFYQEGKFRYIKITPPDRKNGYRIHFIKHYKDKKTTTKSKSVNTNGIKLAFNTVFYALMTEFNISHSSPNTKVLRAIWYSQIAEDYKRLKKVHGS
jgi:hypothetical protein